MSAVGCAIHHVIEVSDENTYRECGECWHVFQTEADLLASDDKIRRECGETESLTSGEDVWSCPECGHDF